MQFQTYWKQLTSNINASKVLDIVSKVNSNIERNPISVIMEATYFLCQKKCNFRHNRGAYINSQQKQSFRQDRSSLFLISKEA